MTIVERLKEVPRSYDDFVRYASECMEEDECLKDKVLEHLNSFPDSTSSDVLKVILDYNGIREPLEIVDDEDKPKPKRSRTTRVAAL